MCNVFCKEFSGWCRSFTRTEVVLVIVEALLLVLFVLATIFLVLHMLVCGNIGNDDRDSSNHSHKPDAVMFSPIVYTNQTISSRTPIHSGNSDETLTSRIPILPDNVEDNTHSTPTYSDNVIDKTDETFTLTSVTTILPDNTNKTFKTTRRTPKYTNNKGDTLECTWGEATVASTHHYYSPMDLDENQFSETRSHVEQLISEEMSDGTKEADYQGSILALAKVDPYVFGCTLSVISEYWAVTAANCVLTIQEQDNLESYLMLESIENGSHLNTRNHTVSGVRSHPLYEKGQSDYDIVALKSADKLLGVGMKPLGLPLMLDYLMITFGETLTLLGFGAFRKSLNSSDGVLRRALVHKLPAHACEGTAGLRRARHLVSVGAGAEAPPAPPPPLCAGVVATRTAPCAYCAGAPLVADGNLVGVMTARRDCALSCRPALYVNVAAVKQETAMPQKGKWPPRCCRFRKVGNRIIIDKMCQMNKALLLCSILMGLFVASVLATAVLQFVVFAGREATIAIFDEDYDDYR